MHFIGDKNLPLSVNILNIETMWLTSQQETFCNYDSGYHDLELWFYYYSYYYHSTSKGFLSIYSKYTKM